MSKWGNAFDPVSAIDVKAATELQASSKDPISEIKRKATENKRLPYPLGLEEQTAVDQIKMLNGMVERGEIRYNPRRQK